MELLILVLAWPSYCLDKKWNTVFFQIICFIECKNMAFETTSVHQQTFIKNSFQQSHGIKKYPLKQVVRITYTLEKMFFAVATFEGLGVVSFQTES